MTDSKTRAAFEAWWESALEEYRRVPVSDAKYWANWAYQAARRAALEEAAKVCADNHLLSGGNGPNFSFGWSMAIGSCAKAIRTLADDGTKD